MFLVCLESFCLPRKTHWWCIKMRLLSCELNERKSLQWVKTWHPCVILTVDEKCARWVREPQGSRANGPRIEHPFLECFLPTKERKGQIFASMKNADFQMKREAFSAAGCQKWRKENQIQKHTWQSKLKWWSEDQFCVTATSHFIFCFVSASTFKI